MFVGGLLLNVARCCRLFGVVLCCLFFLRLLVVGRWLLVVGYWLLVVYRCCFFLRYVLLVVVVCLLLSVSRIVSRVLLCACLGFVCCCLLCVA